jgi:hypothetical protein
LLGLTIKLEEELNIVRVLNGSLGDDVAQRQESIETFGDVPRESLLLGLVLGVAGGEVNGDSVS